MTVQRKTPPKHVVWDQAAILRRISDLESAITAFEQTTGTTSSDDSAVVIRNIRDYEIIEAIKTNTNILLRISEQLEILS